MNFHDLADAANVFKGLFGGFKPNHIPGAPAGVQPKFYAPTRDPAQSPPPKLYSTDEERIKNYIDKQLQTIPFWDPQQQSVKNLKQSCNFLGVPTAAFSEKKEFVQAIEERRNKECAVCMMSFEKDESVKVTLCGHLYHDECLHASARMQSTRGWMPKCPVCRVPIDAKSKRAEEVAAQNRASEETRKRRRV